MPHKATFPWITLAALVLSTSTAVADPFEDGVVAARKKDYATALKLWRPLALQGSGQAQNAIGVMYQQGLGVTRDYAEAVKWYRLAARQGFAEAQFLLGRQYYFGEGVAQSYETAAQLYLLAARQGHVRAHFVLGELYREGKGVQQDYKTAAGFFEWAAKRGDPASQANLGWMYYLGQGVPQDYVRAHMWSNLAAAASEEDKLPASNRDAIAQKMIPEQIAEAQKLARKCQDSNFQECD